MKSAGKSTACAMEDGGDGERFIPPTAKRSRFWRVTGNVARGSGFTIEYTI